jgi:tetratricopeptide (TPR) repeat protein
MDAGLLWTVVGSTAGTVTVVLAAWQVRLQHVERREARRVRAAVQQLDSGTSGTVTSGLPVTVPLGRLPAEVRGRGGLIAELTRALDRHRSAGVARSWRQRRSGRTWVLAGMGGLGKSTVALAVAQAARMRGWRVWWLTATDTASLAGGMLEVLHQLRAPESVTGPVREGALTAAERAWEFLNGDHLATGRWLLVLDNADAPEVLAASAGVSPGDYTGWLRPDPAGMVIVTTRNKDPRVWGPGVMLRELAALDAEDGAKILADLAPNVLDPGGQQARELSRRLGGLPLALQLASSYLASPFAGWHTFAAYQQALDGVELPAALADLDTSATGPRSTIQRTWDLSLDALDRSGQPQARPLLLLLSCYAPATNIPAELLAAPPLADLLAMAAHPPADGKEANGDSQQQVRSALRGLGTAGLISVTDSDGQGGPPAITVHPVVADVNRARLQTTALPVFPQIRTTAVRLVHEAVSELDGGRPADWPAWRLLVPHIMALLEWLATHLDPEATASLLTTSNQAAFALGRSGNYAAAEQLARAAVTAGGSVGSTHQAALNARQSLAGALEGKGRNSEAEHMYRQVLADQEKALGKDHPDTLATRLGLARTISHSRYRQAEQMYRDLLVDQRRILGEEHPQTLITRHALARVVGRQGRAHEAEQMYRQVLADEQQILGDDHPDTLSTRHTLAWAIAAQERYAEAEQHYRQVLADQQRVLGGEHPFTLGTRIDLISSIAGQRRSGEAERLYREVLADYQRVMGQDHPGTLFALLNLADVIAAQGRHHEAEHMYRQLLSSEPRLIGDEHPITLDTVQSLASVLCLQGRYDEAEQLYHQALEGRRRVLGDQHPSTLTTSRALADVIAMQHRYPEAEQLFCDTLTRQEQVLGKDDPDTVRTRRALEQVRTQQGAS